MLTGKPRKKRLIGVASSAVQGGLAGLGTGAALMYGHKSVGTVASTNRKFMGAGALLGAGITGTHKYLTTKPKKLSKPKKIRTY